MSDFIRLATVPITNVDMGHIGIYGPTMSGKTTYAIAFIKHVLKPDRVYVFLGSPAKSWDAVVSSDGFVLHKTFDKLKEVIETCTNDPESSTVVVFDDFNEQINTNSDKYTQLFAQGRHCGIRVINMSNTMKGIGKGAREQLRYVAMTYMNNLEMVKSLASNYLNNDQNRLHENLEVIKGSRNVLVIDTKFGDVIIDNANNYKKEDNYKGAADIIEIPRNNRFYDQLTEYDNQWSTMNGQGSQTSVNPGMRNIYNNGTYNDNSVINFQMNQQIKHDMEMNQWNIHKTKINYEHQRKMKRISERDQLYDLLMKSFFTHEDKRRIIEILRDQCNVGCIDATNWKHYAGKFMKHYYPNVKWVAREGKLNLLTENVNLISNPTRESLTETLYTGAMTVVRNNKKEDNILGQVIRHTPLAKLFD